METLFLINKTDSTCFKTNAKQAAVVMFLDQEAVEHAIEEYGRCDTLHYLAVPVEPPTG